MGCQFLPPAVLGTGWHQLFELGVDDVLPIGDGPGLRIDVVEDILVDGFFVSQELAGFAVQLPQDTVLAGAEDDLPLAHVDQHALVDLVEVEAFAGHMLKIPIDPFRRSVGSRPSSWCTEPCPAPSCRG